jgi:NAD(P)-dependent dehydrogenase (short-subunit alcohol dehydrogenase family)
VSALTGKHALVTGANRGIGAAIVRTLAAQGAAVTLMVRDRAAAERVAAEVATKTHIVTADVSDRAAVRAGCESAAGALGPVDILVNNAGTVETIPFLKAPPEVFTQMFAVHVMGAVHTAQALLPAMLERGGGTIINVASIAGLHGAPYVAHYVAAKHALVGLTRALAAEYRGKGITVNAVCPGYVATDLVSGSLAKISAKTGLSEAEALAAILKDAGQPRIVEAQEVADAVLHFCGGAGAATSGETFVLMGLDR